LERHLHYCEPNVPWNEVTSGKVLCGGFPFHRPHFLFNVGMEISIEHIGLPAKDSARLKAWYERVLGAKHLWDNGEQPPTSLLALGGAWVEIYPATSARPETADNKLAGFRHLALRVASLETARLELEKRGVKFNEDARPAAGGGKVLFFEDGEGNLLHFVERPKDFRAA